MIRSAANPAVRRARRLRKRQWRERTSHVLIEGRRAVGAALEAGAVDEVFYSGRAERRSAALLERASASSVTLRAVSVELMESIASGMPAPDVLGVGTLAVQPQSEAGAAPGLVLSGVHDPRTLAAILAAFAAHGGEEVVIGPRCADVLAPNVIRAAAGAHFRLRMRAAARAGAALDRAREAGARVVRLGEGPPPWEADLGGAICLSVCGDDGDDGAAADVVVGVADAPLPLSLWTAQVLYEWTRQSRGGRSRG
ncbi:MAG TPA: RNA methyltransferase [Actinomycetota bacterium]